MYDYQKIKPVVFTDEGQRMFLRVRDHVHRVLKEAGSITMEKAMAGAQGGDSWEMMACVDRLVELGEIREIRQHGQVAGQHRIFMSA